MKMLMRVIILLILMLNSVMAMSGEGCKVEQYVLASKILCKDYYTIHGLWPDPESSCTFCSEEEFDEKKISANTLELMKIYWPNCMNVNNEKFWEHEWSKHGTCTGMTQEEYFNKGIELFVENKNLCPNGSKEACMICFTPELEKEGLCM